MTERFEENLGKYTFVSLNEIKEYLSITSTNFDSRLSNLLTYSTSIIEHYIGQEVLANNYSEIFDGGTASVYTSRLPLSEVYQVTEFTGTDNKILADPSTNGVSSRNDGDVLTVSFAGNAYTNTKAKKFGQSSFYSNTSGYLIGSTVPNKLRFDESPFTIEMFIRKDSPTISTANLFTIATDSNNFLSFDLVTDNCLSFVTTVDGVSNVVQGAANSEASLYNKKKWSHVAVTADVDNERLYLHYDGNLIANSEYLVSTHTFTSNVTIGKSLLGYIDEVRVSSTPLYTDTFVPTTQRFRPTPTTVALLHFDGTHGSTTVEDAHKTTNEYTFTRDTGKVTRVNSSRLPTTSIGGHITFAPYPNGVTIDYRAGYEASDVPSDLKLVIMDFVKILYKQEQGKQGFAFEGERGDNFLLSSNFPPHIKRVLDMYRIIK